jgi:hypothetical protein
MCKPILHIYVLKYFRWYNEFFNPMSFDPYNRILKILESIVILIPKVGAHFGVCGFIPSHPLTLLEAWNVIPRLHFRPAPLQALALVTNPRLGLWHHNTMATSKFYYNIFRNVEIFRNFFFQKAIIYEGKYRI